MTEIILPPHASLGTPHLLKVDDLSVEKIQLIMDVAEQFMEVNKSKARKLPMLSGQTQINVFYENSTRTRSSFELAGKRLGMDVINMTVSSSSTKKGESLVDTALTLNAMQPDFLVIRHSESGVPHMFSKLVNCAVINAGDGCHAHPTQALLDALTIRRRKKSFSKLKVAICGDILHSRVARSNIQLLTMLGAEVRVIAPPNLLPMNIKKWPITPYHSMQEGLKDVDIIMMLRMQTERMHGSSIPSVREYFHLFGLDRKKFSYAKPDALIMHPGPINRGVEIETSMVDDLQHSIILEQVEAGVAIRQAILLLLAQQLPAQQ